LNILLGFQEHEWLLPGLKAIVVLVGIFWNHQQLLRQIDKAHKIGQSEESGMEGQ
jgi:hypothetical protein